MCRLVAYLGPEIPLRRLVSEGEHSLYKQSYRPREMSSGVVNADGFGFAWYDGARRPEPFSYRNILPIWNDPNLPSVEDYIRSGCVLANVRSATPGQALDYGNTQPFVHGAVSVVHNGFIEGFEDGARSRLRGSLSGEAADLVCGNTDSEYLFARIVQGVAAAGGLAEGVTEALDAVAAALPDRPMTLNFIVTDGRQLVATRHAQGTPCPSLYALVGHPSYPDAALFASEPLFDDDAWTACPDGSILTIGPGNLTNGITTTRLAA